MALDNKFKRHGNAHIRLGRILVDSLAPGDYPRAENEGIAERMGLLKLRVHVLTDHNAVSTYESKNVFSEGFIGWLFF